MVRLKPNEIEAIKSSVLKFLPGAEVYLFGSRIDDSRAGGDIDLLIYSPATSEPDLDTKTKIHWSILEQIGEQKLDMIFTDSLTKTSFIELASSKGIRL